jgi:protein MAK11
VSSDGTIGIIRCGNWQIEKHWLKPHKGLGVDTLAVHPTGKIAMTTGRDGVLRTWNLVKGRQAYATNLFPRWKTDAKNISALKWSPNGNNYLLAANNRIDIYSVESAGIKEEFSFNSKVVCVEFLNDEYIAVGQADGKITIYNLQNASQTSEIQAHSMRVKCLAVNEELLVSASSSGEIKLWSFKEENLTLLNTIDCNARISSMGLSLYVNLKHKKEEVDLENKIPVKLPNNLRSKQRIIIEDEGNDENNPKRAKRPKRKRNRNASKCKDNVSASNENMENAKKFKTNSNENSVSKKQKSDTLELPFESIKKKVSDSNKNKKNVRDLIDKDSTEFLPKKKKQKQEILEEVEVKNNEIHLKAKKRKSPDKYRSENFQKKQKISTTKSLLLKKKSKKNFKNNISK